MISITLLSIHQPVPPESSSSLSIHFVQKALQLATSSSTVARLQIHQSSLELSDEAGVDACKHTKVIDRGDYRSVQYTAAPK